ncbi:MAG: hypothetical protein E7011_00050 [Alphaproteobacteria bacterium]|nr:hypothetical protein [Alphaproteobacteria bacterium]
MRNTKNIFCENNSVRGNILIELLLSVALAVVAIPFIFRYQQDAVIRAQNIAITNQMTEIQVALERYIVANRTELLRTVGRTITRVKLSELEPYGLPPSVLESGDELYQLRILKTADSVGQSSLQGIVVRASDDISPIRTRQIVGLSGGNMGFVDGTRAYGSFGTWHADNIDLGVDIDNALIETTPVNRDNALYLWRVPSDNPDDAKMMSALSLAGHDIINSAYIGADRMEFNQGLALPDIASNSMIFSNRTTIDGVFSAGASSVAGMLSSDSKNLEISGTATVADTAKFSTLTAENLWASNMTLSGLSVDSDGDLSVLKITQSLDMTSGRIDAMFVTVGFAGSMTPRLAVYGKVADSNNPEFYWDTNSNVANLSDISFVELNRMAVLAVSSHGDMSTVSGQIFGAVSANKNATVSDYMNAIQEIQTQVQEKYRLLKL